MTNKYVLCELHGPGASRPRAISAHKIADGTLVDVCKSCLHQILEARLWLNVDIDHPFPTPEQIRTVLDGRAADRENRVH